MPLVCARRHFGPCDVGGRCGVADHTSYPSSLGADWTTQPKTDKNLKNKPHLPRRAALIGFCQLISGPAISNEGCRIAAFLPLGLLPRSTYNGGRCPEMPIQFDETC